MRGKDNRGVSYGELIAGETIRLELADDVPVKDLNAYSPVGQSGPRCDLPAKATGRGNSGVSLGAIVARPRPASGCGATQPGRLCQRCPGAKPVRSVVFKSYEPENNNACNGWG